MTPSQPRQQRLRLAAVLVFVGLPALCLTLGLVNILKVASDRDTVRESEMQTAALERRLGRVASGSPVAQPVLFIEGTSRTAAIAGLQQVLLDAIAANGGRVIETTATDEAVAEGQDADRIEVKTTLDIDNDGLLQLLYRLESGLPLMEIATLSIRRLTGTGEETGAIVLRVDMTASARWKPATEAAP